MITDYATLQSELATLLNRDDLTSAIPGFIQDCESRLRRDPRAYRLVSRGSFSVSGDGAQMPSDMAELESWYHDGPSYYGPIHIVNRDDLSDLKIGLGTTGVAAYAALVDGRARFAPVPDGTYLTQMTYWQKLPRLSASVTTNWLLLEHPDIYKYGSALFAAPYLREDERVNVWSAFYEAALDELDLATQRARFGGALARHVTPIGG